MAVESIHFYLPPHRSSIGRRYPRKRCICCFLLGLLLAVTATGLAVSTLAPVSFILQPHLHGLRFGKLLPLKKVEETWGSSLF